MDFNHIPVLLNETLDSLNINENGIYVDGTAGGGGHSEAILKKLTGGRLISIDQDPDALRAISKRLSKYKQSVIVDSNFSKMDEVIKSLKIDKVDGILLDIGVSSYQLDTAERGFSYHNDAPLDMRMSQKGKSAKDLVNELPWQELARIFKIYGEEKFAKKIALAIEKERKIKKIETTLQLAEIIKNSVPAFARREGHPARQVFQALRIAVNDELNVLEKGLDVAFSILKEGGRLSVITFHSLEDRIVKQKMNSWCIGCTCPPDFPICVCNKKPKAKLLNKKAIIASDEELALNKRSRSAKLRTCIRL